MAKILMIEDECELAQMVKDFLSSDFDISLAHSCAEAKKLLLSESFDLIFSDNSLPDGTGVDVASWMRSSGILYPIIFGTGYAENELLKKCLHLGAVSFIEKPYDFKELTNIIYKVMMLEERKKQNAINPNKQNEKMIGLVQAQLAKTTAS